jgi:general secretion pathway protein D
MKATNMTYSQAPGDSQHTGSSSNCFNGFPVLPRRIRVITLLALFLFVCFELQAQFPGGGFGGFPGGGGTTSSRSRTTRSYPNNGVGDATFSVDPDTRSLVVVADQDTTKYISEVLSNLDRPKPQVLIKVVFLEVTRNDASDIGVEGTFSKNVGSSFANGLFGTNFALLNPGTTNFAIVPTSINPLQSSTRVSGANLFGPGAAAGSTLPAAAGLYQIMGEDYTVTLHAIAQAGKAKVLSRPSVVTRNNQPATILVGQTVPLITSVRYDTFGNAINGITYTDVGIILRVTPFITRDGTVEMILSPEISSVSKTDSTPLGTGSNSVNAPFIDKRSADTVVVTPDGSTVIIGGMIQTSKAESENKIPYLGDIPLLGNLFKRKFKSDVNTELLIFLTPHIIQAPTEMAAMTEIERAKSGAAKAFSEQELNKFLDSLPSKDAQNSKKKKKPAE